MPPPNTKAGKKAEIIKKVTRLDLCFIIRVLVELERGEERVLAGHAMDEWMWTRIFKSWSHPCTHPIHASIFHGQQAAQLVGKHVGFSLSAVCLCTGEWCRTY